MRLISPCEPDSWDFYFDKTAVKSKLFTGVHEIICLNILYEFIAYQNKIHTFNWLNTLHVIFTIPRYRLKC